MKIFLNLIVVFFLVLIISAAYGDDDELFVPKTFTAENTFPNGVEGPAVDCDGNLYAVNYDHKGTIGKVTPDGECSLFVELPSGSVGNGIRFNSRGEMLIADYTNHNILRVKMDTKKIDVYAHDDRMNQPNDIAITDNDIIYASDPNWSDGTGNLWMIDTTGTTHLLFSDMGTTNGVEVSPDNKTLYVGEGINNQNRILAFDILNDGTLSNKRVVKQYDDDSVLDGMRCDSSGNLYVACYDKGKIYIVSPNGTPIRNITMSADKVTNIAFGGPDGKRCYVTVGGNGNIETFLTDTPGRSWVMRNPVSGINDKPSDISPKSFNLRQNSPNPFNPKTKIEYELKYKGYVELSVFNIEGKEITTLVKRNQSPGKYSIVWNGAAFPSGIYLYRLHNDNYSEVKKMTLLK